MDSIKTTTALPKQFKATTSKKNRLKKIFNNKSYKKLNVQEPPVENWWKDPSILITFALPRITARIEKLMGSNVIRLTDRKFMNEVRARMQRDYEIQLKKRITQREVKETERERNLILEGKSDVVPDGQSDHPIFIVNKAANEISNARRAKLKTNREKNAERLASQFVKWEKERGRYDQLDSENQEKRIQNDKEENALIVAFTKEDKKLGLDLLRIHDQNWRPCEENLKKFLEKERAKIKERAESKISTPFLSDPRDIQNIIKARKLFRETEKKVREDLVTQTDTVSDTIAAKKALVQACVKLKEVKQKKEFSFDIEFSDSNISVMDKIEFDTDKNRNDKIIELEASIESDVEKDLIMPVDKQQALYFEDPKIAQLRTTDTISQLYKLAKEIIAGDTESISDDEEDIENEDLDEDEENEEEINELNEKNNIEREESDVDEDEELEEELEVEEEEEEEEQDEDEEQKEDEEEDK